MKHLMYTGAALLLLSYPVLAFSGEEAPGLVQVERTMPLLGHRNWVVVTDAAYPLQSNPGIKTIVVDDDQVNVIKTVLKMLEKQKHVRPLVYTDAELCFVREQDAPGIDVYREELRKILPETGARSLPHEEIIAKLDKASSIFNVFIIKTRGLLPYTSVFFELDCAYWSEQGEKRLRDEIKKVSPS